MMRPVPMTVFRTGVGGVESPGGTMLAVGGGLRERALSGCALRVFARWLMRLREARGVSNG